MDNSIEKSRAMIQKSWEVYKALLTTDSPVSVFPPAEARDQDFNQDFPGRLIHKPFYSNCRFNSSAFLGSDGAYTRLYQCGLFDCELRDCDFRYCDFWDSKFESIENKEEIASCNFSYGSFINTSFSCVDISGTSFRQMQIEGCTFDNCSISYSTFEQSTITSCIIENMDFRNASFRFCEFEGTTIKNVYIHILDILKNYGLLEALLANEDTIQVVYGNGHVSSLAEALDLLQQTLAFYHDTKQYYQIIIYLKSRGEFEKLYATLKEAVKYTVSQNDFPSLMDLCRLIVKMDIYDKKELMNFYGLILNCFKPETLPYYLNKSYASYIENIKNVLVNNPEDFPTAQIQFKTNINPADYSNLAMLIEIIENNIRIISPDISPIIQLSHHSPFDILVIISGAFPNILSICQMFYYAFGGAKSLVELAGSKRERIEKKEIALNKRASSIQPVEKQVTLSIGQALKFEYRKEYKEKVESVEYFIL